MCVCVGGGGMLPWTSLISEWSQQIEMTTFYSKRMTRVSLTPKPDCFRISCHDQHHLNNASVGQINVCFTTKKCVTILLFWLQGNAYSILKVATYRTLVKSRRILLVTFLTMNHFSVRNSCQSGMIRCL